MVLLRKLGEKSLSAFAKCDHHLIKNKSLVFKKIGRKIVVFVLNTDFLPLLFRRIITVIVICSHGCLRRIMIYDI